MKKKSTSIESRHKTRPSIKILKLQSSPCHEQEALGFLNEGTFIKYATAMVQREWGQPPSSSDSFVMSEIAGLESLKSSGNFRFKKSAAESEQENLAVFPSNVNKPGE